MKNLEKKHKKNNTSKLSWKRSVIVTLVVSLVLGSLSFADSSPKAQAAEYDKITNIKSFGLGKWQAPWVGTTLELSSGRSIVLPTFPTPGPSNGIPAYVAPVGAKDVKFLYVSEKYPTKYYVPSYISSQGDLYIDDELVSGDVEQFISTEGIYMILKKDETVEAWGKGSAGELGIGYKQNKLIPTEVVDPETGDAIQGIKKIFVLSSNQSSIAFLLVSDTEVYLVGRAFGLDSRNAAKPIKLGLFPEFKNADFELEFLQGVPHYWEYGQAPNFSQTTGAFERRVFTIAGKKYALTNFLKDDYGPVRAITEVDNTVLIPLEDDFDVNNLKKSTKVYYYAGNYGGRSVINTYLKDGVLEYSGDIDYYGTNYPRFSEVKTQVATNVDFVTNNRNGQFWYIRNKGLYAFGLNPGGQLGVDGGHLKTPVKISGSSNEVKNVKAFAVSNQDKFILKEDGSLITFTKSNDFTTSSEKYLDLFSITQDAQGTNKVYGIGEDFNLYQLTSTTQRAVIGEGIFPALAPKDYIAPISAPEKPILSIVSQDKFNQSVVSVDFGTFADIATKQYQINGGGWTNYVGDIVVSQTGSVKIEARSADSKGNMSEVGEITVTSAPIVISPGQPTIDKISENEYKISADATGNVKVQVKVDGAAWQEFNTANNLLLTPGDHVIEIRLLNERDQELIGRTFNVTADNPAPSTIKKPELIQHLSEQFELNIEVIYDDKEGELHSSVDGATWHTTGHSLIVSNYEHKILAKVVAADGTESEITEFVTTPIAPKITINNDQVSIDPGIELRDAKLFYKDPMNNQWLRYFIPLTLSPGNYGLEVEVRDSSEVRQIWSGGPYPVTITDPNAGNPDPGNGGTTPTPNPGQPAQPISDEEVDFTIHSGGLSSRFEGIDLSTIVIDSTNPYQQINSVSNAYIDDSTGRAGGWQYSLQITDFVSEPMYDSSTQENGLVVSIPSTSFSVNVGASKTLAGPENQLSNVGKKVFSTDAQVLALANPFEGMGYYQIPLNFTMSVPDRVKVVKSSNGSKYISGQDTGLMAGVYKSTFTFTLTSGI